MAPPAPRECNQPARSALHRKQSAHRAAQRSALHRNQLAAHCIANNPRTVQRSAAHCLASCTSPRTARMQPPARNALHRKQSARMQPARASQTIRAPTTNPPRIARRAVYLPHGEHLAPAALHALRSTLRWFRFVRGTNFSKIQFKYIANCIWLCVRSSVGTELGNLKRCPGFDSGRKLSDFFLFSSFSSLIRIKKNSKF
jgi:hypothetical protein